MVPARTPPAACGRGARRRLLPIAAAVASLLPLAACGKKGPPLPPLLKLPAPPPDFAVERRGGEVRLRFTVPSANTDGSRPANIDHVDVYGFTGPAPLTDDQLLRFGTKVATVAVKAPKDPGATTEPDEPPEEPDLTEEGLDQGAVAELTEPLAPEDFTPGELPAPRRRPPAPQEAGRPLVGPPRQALVRTFVAVGVNTSGRKGPLSKRALVPLVDPPLPPAALTVTYTEQAVTLAWAPASRPAPVQARPPEDAGLLPARYVGMELPSLAYNVYEVSLADGASGAAEGPPAGEVRLTTSPVEGTAFEDKRIEWGRTRCYAVRTVESVGGAVLESDAAQQACVTLEDVFPPAPPANLQHIAAEGVISLIWDANREPDLAGYLVLRGAPGGPLEAITPAPITATVFEDKVPSGTTYAYAVQAVDRAGNRSAPSATVEDTAR